MKRFIPYVILLISSALPAAAFTPNGDGIYAVFDVSYFETSELETIDVEFTVQLLYDHSPVTCANFIGLASGELAWYNFETRQVETNHPYFDGLVFHRVVPNFVIQTGSPDGSGGDGPGWQLPDEMHPDLNHVSGGVVSMANASSGQGGSPNSGGSQFFITMVQFDHTQGQLDALNGRHSIFGFIIEGSDVTQAINRTPIQGTRPIVDVVINSVTILKQGAAANAWDPSLYWVAPTFSNHEVVVTNDPEDFDNDPDTDPIRVLRANWQRDKDSQYFFDDSNNLETWRTSFFDRTEAEDSLESLFIEGEVGLNGRHFYRLLEAALPELPNLEGEQIIVNFDPIEIDEDFVNYLPEQLTIDFYDQLEGGFELQRSDNTNMRVIGSVNGYRMFPLGDRSQIEMNLNFFSNMQAYLDYETPNSGSVYVFYPGGRREGSIATGTFTLGAGNDRRVPLNKDGTGLVLTLVTTPDNGSESVTTTTTLDVWDNFSEVELNDNFEGGYSIELSNSEFIQTGRLLYQWMDLGDRTVVILDFDIVQDMQVQLSGPDASSGSIEVYFPVSDTIESGTFTSGPGNPRPDSIDQTGNKLVLNLELTGSGPEPLQSSMDIDFYDATTGAFVAERTDSDADQFGEVLEYAWFNNNGRIRVDLQYDTVPAMQAYLTFSSQDEAGTGSGSAEVHYPNFGQVIPANFIFTVGGGSTRPEPLDKTGTQLVLEFGEETFNVLTIDLTDTNTGIYEIERQDSPARPTGVVLSYNWTERSNGTELVDITFERLPPMQIVLTPTPGSAVGEAVVLFIESGEVNTIGYSVGPASAPLISINQAGKKLTVDLETSDTNQLTDSFAVNFRDIATGDWLRNRQTSDTVDTGAVEFYEWFEKTGYDQVNVLFDFFLDTQIFLDYTNATSGTASVFFITGQNIESGTFTITDADP